MPPETKTTGRSLDLKIPADKMTGLDCSTRGSQTCDPQQLPSILLPFNDTRFAKFRLSLYLSPEPVCIKSHTEMLFIAPSATKSEAAGGCIKLNSKESRKILGFLPDS
jgi:hypothetical protein